MPLHSSIQKRRKVKLLASILCMVNVATALYLPRDENGLVGQVTGTGAILPKDAGTGVVQRIFKRSPQLPPNPTGGDRGDPNDPNNRRPQRLAPEDPEERALNTQMQNNPMFVELATNRMVADLTMPNTGGTDLPGLTNYNFASRRPIRVPNTTIQNTFEETGTGGNLQQMLWQNQANDLPSPGFEPSEASQQDASDGNNNNLMFTSGKTSQVAKSDNLGESPDINFKMGFTPSSNAAFDPNNLQNIYLTPGGLSRQSSTTGPTFTGTNLNSQFEGITMPWNYGTAPEQKDRPEKGDYLDELSQEFEKTTLEPAPQMQSNMMANPNMINQDDPQVNPLLVPQRTRAQGNGIGINSFYNDLPDFPEGQNPFASSLQTNPNSFIPQFNPSFSSQNMQQMNNPFAGLQRSQFGGTQMLNFGSFQPTVAQPSADSTTQPPVNSMEIDVEESTENKDTNPDAMEEEKY